MKTLVISNKGLIDQQAFHLMGASTKRDDCTKIGFFGSGLKYALPVLIRNSIGFSVYAGTRKIEIGTLPESIRNCTFDVITVDGVKTSFTTEMGPKWEVWQAIRELYCNALDEEDCFIRQVVDPLPSPDRTEFHIEMQHPKLLDLINNWDAYFCTNIIPIVTSAYGSVLPSPVSNTVVFRKGVRCCDYKEHALYSYDLPDISINESRVASSSWEVKRGTARLWARSATEDMIRLLVNSIHTKPYEYNLYWSAVPCSEFQQQWEEFFSDKIIVPDEFAGWFVDELQQPNAVRIPDELAVKLSEAFPNLRNARARLSPNGEYVVRETTDIEQFKIKKALDFFKEVKLRVDYDIVVADFVASNVLGCADKSKVVIAGKTFDLGVRQVVLTILEEIAHLESGAKDNTREFQNYFLNQLLNCLETCNGVFL